MSPFDESRVLYEDNHLIVVNKRVGEIVQADKTGDATLADAVKSFIKARDRKPGNVFLGITHRIDRPTSGVVVFAKTGKALGRMNDLFRRGEVGKTYWAVVAVPLEPGEGTLQHHLRRNEKQNKSYAMPQPSGGSKPASLSYLTLASSERYTLLEIRMQTGRHHQIRAQLSAVGSPIKGDLKYGFPRSNPDGGIHLHARQVSFLHPVSSAEVAVTAPVPEDTLWGVFGAMVGVDL